MYKDIVVNKGIQIHNKNMGTIYKGNNNLFFLTYVNSFNSMLFSKKIIEKYETLGLYQFDFTALVFLDKIQQKIAEVGQAKQNIQNIYNLIEMHHQYEINHGDMICSERKVYQYIDQSLEMNLRKLSTWHENLVLGVTKIYEEVVNNHTEPNIQRNEIAVEKIRLLINKCFNYNLKDIQWKYESKSVDFVEKNTTIFQPMSISSSFYNIIKRIQENNVLPSAKELYQNAIHNQFLRSFNSKRYMVVNESNYYEQIQLKNNLEWNVNLKKDLIEKSFSVILEKAEKAEKAENTENEKLELASFIRGRLLNKHFKSQVASQAENQITIRENNQFTALEKHQYLKNFKQYVHSKEKVSSELKQETLIRPVSIASSFYYIIKKSYKDIILPSSKEMFQSSINKQYLNFLLNQIKFNELSLKQTIEFKRNNLEGQKNIINQLISNIHNIRERITNDLINFNAIEDRTKESPSKTLNQEDRMNQSNREQLNNQFLNQFLNQVMHQVMNKDNTLEMKQFVQEAENHLLSKENVINVLKSTDVLSNSSVLYALKKCFDYKNETHRNENNKNENNKNENNKNEINKNEINKNENNKNENNNIENNLKIQDIALYNSLYNFDASNLIYVIDKQYSNVINNGAIDGEVNHQIIQVISNLKDNQWEVIRKELNNNNQEFLDRTQKAYLLRVEINHVIDEIIKSENANNIQNTMYPVMADSKEHTSYNYRQKNIQVTTETNSYNPMGTNSYNAAETNVYDTTETKVYDTTGTNVYDTTGTNVYDTTGTNVYNTTGTKVYDTAETNHYNTMETNSYDAANTNIYETTDTNIYLNNIGYDAEISRNFIRNQLFKDISEDAKAQVLVLWNQVQESRMLDSDRCMQMLRENTYQIEKNIQIEKNSLSNNKKIIESIQKKFKIANDYDETINYSEILKKNQNEIHTSNNPAEIYEENQYKINVVNTYLKILKMDQKQIDGAITYGEIPESQQNLINSANNYAEIAEIYEENQYKMNVANDYLEILKMDQKQINEAITYTGILERQQNFINSGNNYTEILENPYNVLDFADNSMDILRKQQNEINIENNYTKIIRNDQNLNNYVELVKNMKKEINDITIEGYKGNYINKELNAQNTVDFVKRIYWYNKNILTSSILNKRELRSLLIKSSVYNQMELMGDEIPGINTVNHLESRDAGQQVYRIQEENNTIIQERKEEQIKLEELIRDMKEKDRTIEKTAELVSKLDKQIVVQKEAVASLKKEQDKLRGEVNKKVDNYNLSNKIMDNIKTELYLEKVRYGVD